MEYRALFWPFGPHRHVGGRLPDKRLHPFLPGGCIGSGCVMPKILEPIWRILYPAQCVLCGRLLADDRADLCKACEISAQVFPFTPWRIPHLKSWLPLWQYRGEVRGSLVRYKFYHRRNYCLTYGREMAKMLGKAGVRYDVITWVPISFLRRVERGYDQVELLAQEVGKHLGCAPVKLLHKRRHNRRQSGLRSMEARRRNVAGAYRAVNTELIKDKRVLLLEDIITTGATISEAARVLKEAGAKEVHGACIAAANRHGR